MRGYFLTNMYLSPIQHGIQSAHCIHDMFIKYQEYSDASYNGSNMQKAYEVLIEWASNHKTMIVLNGGTGDDLREALRVFTLNSVGYPYDVFNEPSIDNALTCVGIILPETFSFELVDVEDTRYDSYDQQIARLLTSKHLAR
jgi:hypothetical protein